MEGFGVPNLETTPKLPQNPPASWDLLRDVGEGGALMSAYRLEDDTVWAIPGLVNVYRTMENHHF